MAKKEIKLNQKETKVINLATEQDAKEVKISAKLTKEERERLVSFLKEFIDIFALSYQHMPRLDTDIVTYKFPLKEGYKPVKQKFK